MRVRRLIDVRRGGGALLPAPGRLSVPARVPVHVNARRARSRRSSVCFLPLGPLSAGEASEHRRMSRLVLMLHRRAEAAAALAGLTHRRALARRDRFRVCEVKSMAKIDPAQQGEALARFEGTVETVFPHLDGERFTLTVELNVGEPSFPDEQSDAFKSLVEGIVYVGKPLERQMHRVRILRRLAANRAEIEIKVDRDPATGRVPERLTPRKKPPFVLTDDDEEILPVTIDHVSRYLQEGAETEGRNLWARCFLVPVYERDLSGEVPYQRNLREFILASEGGTPDRIASFFKPLVSATLRRTLRDDAYLSAYVLFAYQDKATFDLDPNAERGTLPFIVRSDGNLGLAHVGSGVSVVAVETIREYNARANNADRRDELRGDSRFAGEDLTAVVTEVATHELSHLLGAEHGSGIMGESSRAVARTLAELTLSGPQRAEMRSFMPSERRFRDLETDDAPADVPRDRDRARSRSQSPPRASRRPAPRDAGSSGGPGPERERSARDAPASRGEWRPSGRRCCGDEDDRRPGSGARPQ